MTDKKSKFSADSSLLGYIYQLRCALLLLVANRNFIHIYLERTDDIEIVDKDYQKVIQVKRHKGLAYLNNKNVDLWKTIHNWISEHSYNLDNKKFLLITTSKISGRSLANDLGFQERNPSRALQSLKKIASENLLNETENKNYYEKFHNLSTGQQKYLVDNMYIISEHADLDNIVERIKEEIRYSIRPKFINDLYEKLEGWWINIVIDHLENNKEINSDTIRFKIHDLQEQYALDTLPVSNNKVLNTNKDDEKRVFVKQLRLIEISEIRKLNAIMDFYRANSNRQNWVNMMPEFSERIKEYDEELIDAWKIRFEIMRGELENNNNPNEIITSGRNFYNKIETEIEIPIRPSVMHHFITRGSYHILSDQLRVGWHLNYEKLLKGG